MREAAPLYGRPQPALLHRAGRLGGQRLRDQIRRARVVRHAEEGAADGELITQHSAIMDQYDPEKRIG